jgi:hypothetical protein
MTWKRTRVGKPDQDAQRRLELETRKAEQGHEIALADLDDEKADARQTRRERRADRREARKLANLSRQVKVSGARIAAAHNLTDTGEYRALKIQKIRRVSLTVLLPVLIAFASWSTIGVQAGAAKLLGVISGSLWTGAYFIEPALGTIVAGIIIVRAALRSAGGELGSRATAIEWGALTVSLILNLAGAWPEGGGTQAIAATVVHSIGPVGLMTTAFLIAIIDDAVANAKPYEGHPSLADPAVLIDSVPVSHGTELGQARGTKLGQGRGNEVGQSLSQPERPGVPRLSRPKVVPVSQPDPSHAPGTDLVVSQPKVSQNEQYEKVVAAWETARDTGQSQTVRAIALSTGVPRSTVDRILKPYKAQAGS